MLIARIVAISLVGIAALAVPPGAVAHEGGGLAVVAEPDHGPRGATVTLTGDDFFPGHSLDIRFVVHDESESIGAATVGDDGHFSIDVRIPPAAPVGAAAIDVVTPAGIVQRVLITVDEGPVVGPAGPAGDDPPPADPSSDALPAALFGAGVVASLIVGLAIISARRRTTARSTSRS